jgi:hypothetical protein
MKATLKEFMDFLGVDHIMNSYETDIIQHYDEAQGLTCSAEVRMGSDQRDLEAEVQLFYDEPPAGKPPVEQIMLMKAKPKVTGPWEPVFLLVKGENMTNKFPDWEESACQFYAAITYHLKRGEMPNIDALIDEHMDGEGGFAGRGGRRRGGGRKNPKFKPPTKTPGMKQGM